MQGRHADALTAFQDVEARDTGGEHVGEEFFAGMCLVGLERIPEAIPNLEAVLASDFSIPDPLMTKYRVGGAMEVGITPGVSVTVPMSNLAVALILAEAYQRTNGRRPSSCSNRWVPKPRGSRCSRCRSPTSTSRATSGTTLSG